MLETIKEKHKLNKWYYFIPVLGAMIYSVMFELSINNLVLKGQKQYKKIKKYKSIFNLIALSIGLVFLILFFVLRNKHGYGSWPWFFWVGLSIGLGQNVVPYIAWYLYKLGIENFEKTGK